MSRGCVEWTDAASSSLTRTFLPVALAHDAWVQRHAAHLSGWARSSAVLQDFVVPLGICQVVVALLCHEWSGKGAPASSAPGPLEISYPRSEPELEDLWAAVNVRGTGVRNGQKTPLPGGVWAFRVARRAAPGSRVFVLIPNMCSDSTTENCVQCGGSGGVGVGLDEAPPAEPGVPTLRWVLRSALEGTSSVRDALWAWIEARLPSSRPPGRLSPCDHGSPGDAAAGRTAGNTSSVASVGESTVGPRWGPAFELYPRSSHGP